MPLRFVTDPTPADWNARIAATPSRGNVYQSHEIGEVKRLARWTPRYAESEGIAMTIHEKSAGLFGSVWYLPKGPCVADPEQLGTVLADLAAEARRQNVLFVRIEPELTETPEHLRALTDLGLVQTSPVQPHTSTVIHALPETVEELMGTFPSKTRNMVRRAGREGVVVEPAPDTEETYEQMWELWQDVVADQGLVVRGRDYFVESWKIMVRTGFAQVFMARVEEERLAWALVCSLGSVAAYKEGASLRDRPVPGVSQLVQYEGMAWAIGRGARSYDLVGTPHSTRLDDPEDMRYGIGKFKRGFTKEVTDWVGAFDLVIHPRRYAAWQRAGERVVARLQRRGPGDAFW